jgi:glycosyltransferase involved in cell wall biosynthesis
MRICAIGLRGIPDVMGGIETHCEHLYPRLAKLDDTLEIIVIGRSGYSTSGAVANVRVVTLWAPRRKPLETLVHTPLAILYARLFLHPDVIHLHAVGPGFFAPLARLLGFRVIGTHHAADYERPKWGRLGRWFLKAGEGMLARFADQVICVSGWLEARLSKEYPEAKQRFVTIRNGVPPAMFGEDLSDTLLASLGLKRGQYILCVGRLDPSKAFHDVVRAFELSKPSGMKLVIVGGSIGSDDYADKLKESASDPIIFAGACSANHVQTFYRNAALFVHPSHHEVFAMVVLEALAADAPILLSDIPAHLDVGLGSESYYPRGDVSVLAARLKAGNYSRLRSSRRAEILEENDWDTVARRHRDVLIKCLSGRRRCNAETPSSKAAPR